VVTNLDMAMDLDVETKAEVRPVYGGVVSGSLLALLFFLSTLNIPMSRVGAGGAILSPVNT
jgi:hypothetical protein